MTRSTPACVGAAELFQHPLLEGSKSAKTSDERIALRSMVLKARSVCAGCPLLEQCRYDAITRFDVAGVVGGTTATERSSIRRMLGVRVAQEDFDTLAGASPTNGQVDHEEVIRLRKMDPSGTLERIAQRLGCSLSTVKRHLRQARTEPRPVHPQPNGPPLQEVNAAAETVLRPRSSAA